MNTTISHADYLCMSVFSNKHFFNSYYYRSTLYFNSVSINYYKNSNTIFLEFYKMILDIQQHFLIVKRTSQTTIFILRFVFNTHSS